MTPDPAGMAAADPANPQSWNRYAYVMNNPLNATDPLGLCYFGDGATIGVSGPRNPGLECGTGALDSSDPGGCMTDASCSGAPVGPSHDDPAGTADSFFDQSIAQNTAQAEASYSSYVDAVEQTGGTYVRDGKTYTVGWDMGTGAFWTGPNGEQLSAGDDTELGLPGFFGQRKGERGQTAKPDNPTKV